MNTVLVAYATKHGSTEGVAARIGDTLRERGMDVTLLRAREVRDVTAYTAVALGAPIYNGRWHRQGRRFLKRHRRSLTTRPLAIFAQGPRTNDEEDRERSQAQLDRALRKFAWLRRVEVALFGGVDPPKRNAQHQRDARDWDAIEAWARHLADEWGGDGSVVGIGGTDRSP